MAAVRSAGLLLYRSPAGTGSAAGGASAEGAALEVLLGHMGGPFWGRKDERAWSIFKGEIEPGEDEQAAALREFREETGSVAPAGELLALGEVKQRSGKVVVAWALAGEFDPATLSSNTFEVEWPPRSGRVQAFPEIDRAAWFTLEAARAKLVAAQVAFLDRLREILTPR